MKHIVIDARIRQSSTGRYMDRLLNELQLLDVGGLSFTVILTTKDNLKPINGNFEFIACKYPVYSFNPIQQISFARWLYSLKADVIHFGLSPNDPVFYFKPIITTTHDLTMFEHAEAGRLSRIFHILRMVGYRFLMWQTHRKARLIITPTKYVNKVLLARYPFISGKTNVTYEAGDSLPTKHTSQPKVKPAKYILHTGNVFAHKNSRRLVFAFSRLKQDYPELRLVFVGKRDYYSNYLEDWIKSELGNLYKDVVFTGFVNDQELGWYYQNAQAYIFPSLSEGFGLPGLEAMAHGCPVVSSNATCLPEVYGEAAHYFDPINVDDMAEKISEVLKSKKLRQKLVNNGYRQLKKYSWEKMAQETLAIYNKVLLD